MSPALSPSRTLSRPVVRARALHRLCRPALAAAVLLAANAAPAALVTGSFAFSATGFPAGAPAGLVEGIVHFSFDNSATFFGAADGSTQNGAPVQVSFSGLSLAGAWTPVLSFVKDGVIGGNPVQDLMSIGHQLNGTGVVAGTDDWRLAFNSISSNPSFREFTYASAGAPGALFMTFNGQVTAVPEPGSAWMVAAGLAALAGWARRRRRVQD